MDLNLLVKLILIFYLQPNWYGECGKYRAQRVLFSKKTPIWFAESDKNNSHVIKFTPVNENAFNNALRFYDSPDNMIEFDLRRNAFGNYEIGEKSGNYSKSEYEKKKKLLRELWEEQFNLTFSSEIKKSTHPRQATDFRMKKRSISHERTDYRVHLPPENSPSKIHPKILLFVNFSESYTSDTELRFYKLLIFLVAFWNGVNVGFSEFSKPGIELHVAGIVIAKDKSAAPYLSSQMNDDLSYRLDIKFAFMNFLSLNNPAPGSWDIAISQANYHSCGKSACPGKNVLSMSMVGHACNPASLPPAAVALIFRGSDFGAVPAVLHEMGHLLGSLHDEDVDEKSCQGDFIMSIKNKLLIRSWSECSKKKIKESIKNKTSSCWNAIAPIDRDDELPEILPGYLMSLDAQCALRGYESANTEETTCDSLRCNNPTSLLGVYDYKATADTGPPMYGSKVNCKKNEGCRLKKCLLKSLVTRID